MASDPWRPTVTTGGEMEEPVRAYGSTATNVSVSAVSGDGGKKNRNHEDIDIQLYDFKQTHNYKDPLIPERQAAEKPIISEGKRSHQRPTSLPSSHSSDQPSVAFSETSFNQGDSWLRHPKVRENWRIVLTSFLLTILGIGLLLAGIIVAITPSRGWHCFIFAFIGLLCVIPGGYHFVYIYCAAMDQPGYRFENLPVLR